MKGFPVTPEPVGKIEGREGVCKWECCSHKNKYKWLIVNDKNPKFQFLGLNINPTFLFLSSTLLNF